MDLTGMIQNPAETQGDGQRMSKEEYAAMKKQEREDMWMQIDAQAQEVFRDGESLQKFLDFMAGQSNMPRVPNLLLLYSQNPDLHLVRSREEWRRENRYPQPDARSYTYIIQTEYEKDGVTRQGYAVGKGFDVSETGGKPLEDRPGQSIQTLLGAVLKNQGTRLQVSDQLPEGVTDTYYNRENGVIYSQDERKSIIINQIKNIEIEKNIKVEIDYSLLDEVIAITEYPNALYGEFDDKFLELPSEVIITSMKINQKYFATYKNEKLNNGFIVICNAMDKSAFDCILDGNKRVLKARLEDALFFYKNDLNSFVQDKIDHNLKNIEFIQDSGSLFDKVNREIEIAKILSKNLNIESSDIIRAISICKNDLLSEMVGEFGELQGVMGSYYTQNDALKLMIKEQYLPLQEDSKLPTTLQSAIVSISNRLDSIISLFAIDKIPSGSKDPFALRRACSGIIKMIIKFEIPFNLFEILLQLESHYKSIDANKIFKFFCERLEGTLNINQSVINAAIKSNQKDLYELVMQIFALHSFVNTNDDFRSLFKRIANILKNAQIMADSINVSLFECDDERNLFYALEEFRLLDISTPKDRIEGLLGLKDVLQKFFDNVMINADNEKIRKNRILLVNSIYEEFLKVGDIKEISF